MYHCVGVGQDKSMRGTIGLFAEKNRLLVAALKSVDGRRKA